MTASLPKHRLEQIQDTVKKLGEDLNEINGPAAWEQVKRYRRIKNEDENVPVDEVLERYQKGEKVLCVCNTVGRAICFAKQIESKAPDCNLIVYHSHFKYSDRCKKHEKTIQAFKSEKPVICITTQVAEMSLDISADFLVTDLAPIPALIQRLGRLNRRTEHDGEKLFLVLQPQKDGKPLLLPYEDNGWWPESKKWLQELGETGLSQTDLITAWEKIVTGKKPVSVPGTPPWAKALDHEPNPLRKIFGGSCEVILEEDIAEIRRGGKTSYLKCVIPMNTPTKEIPEPIINHKYGCFVVKNGEGISYDSKIGAFWINPKDKSKSTPDGIEGPLIF